MRFWPTIAAGLVLVALALSLVGRGRTIIGVAQCIYALALVALLVRRLTRRSIQACNGAGSGEVGGGGTSSGIGGTSG